MNRVKIIYGEHKGKKGRVKATLWASGIQLVVFDDGTEVAVRLCDTIPIL